MPKLVNWPSVEGAECRRQSGRSVDQPELGGGDVKTMPEPRPMTRTLRPKLGLAFRLGKRIRPP